MDVFEKTYLVKQDDLDDLNHVNNVRYVQWVQDIAETHWLKKASQEILDQFYWVMISHNLTYKSPAFLNEELLIRTYVTSSEGVTSHRHVEFINAKTKGLLVKSETKWCLISKTSQKPTRITETIKKLFN